MEHHLSRNELEVHLNEQLELFRLSCEGFDRGNEVEAKRLAVTLRLLLHNGGQSKSLLKQLDKESIQFTDTAYELDHDNPLPQGSLIAIGIGSGRYHARLDSGQKDKAVDFSTWWSTPIFLDKNQDILTREDLVLIAANQDGGTHVDPTLDRVYHALTRSNSLSWITGHEKNWKSIGNPAGAAIRQIAHEVLRTLRPNYLLKPQISKDDIWISGIRPVFADKKSSSINQSNSAYEKVGRNQPCPCGSGKKYKLCHGR